MGYAVRAHHILQVYHLLKTPNLDVWSVIEEVVDGSYPFIWALDMMGDNPICDDICKYLLARPNPERLSQAAQQLQSLPTRIYLGRDRYSGCQESCKPLLCYTVIHRRFETFKFLLEAGLNYEEPDGRGRTALSYAEESRWSSDVSKSMAVTLLARGADQFKLDHERLSLCGTH
jgi:ankyrin repeat protein